LGCFAAFEGSKLSTSGSVEPIAFLHRFAGVVFQFHVVGVEKAGGRPSNKIADCMLSNATYQNPIVYFGSSQLAMI
jgi:hypothetical protein